MANRQLLPRLPRRLCIVGWQEFLVPKYIVRIDIEEPKQTHGWQVRFNKPFVFFSDAAYPPPRSKVGTPASSLKAAIQHLATVWRPKAPHIQAERHNKAIPTGMAGVRVIWQSRAGRKVKSCSVEARGRDGALLGRYYAGTENTITAASLQQALNEARADRRRYNKELLERHQQDVRTTIAKCVPKSQPSDQA